MGLEILEDLKRRPVELNLAAARKIQSCQTGYLHVGDVIPVLENCCFALALLRSKIADQVLEAKTLLEKLLPFEVDGNFPLYLHEYPQCKKRSFSVDLIPIFYWILNEFEQVLGDELKLKLEQLIARLASNGYRAHAQKPLHPISLAKLYAYFEPQRQVEYIPATAEEWGEMLIAYQMAQSQGRDWDFLWKEALSRWNCQLCASSLVQTQYRDQPKTTLFDLFLGHYYGRYADRVTSPASGGTHLQAGLIQPFSPPPSLSVDESHLWSRHAPHTLYWGSSEMLHSLVFDGKKAEVQVRIDQKGAEFCVKLPETAPPEGEDSYECSFYLNCHPDHHIFVSSDGVSNEKASAWQLDQRIEICSGDRKLEIEFAIEEGEGAFYGHLLRGNRPSQKGVEGFAAYDWRIALRTIRRSQGCTLKIRLALASGFLLGE